MGDRELIDFKKLTNKEMLVVLVERQGTTHDMLVAMDARFDQQIKDLKVEFDKEKKVSTELRIESAKQSQKWLLVGGFGLFVMSLLGNYLMSLF